MANENQKSEHDQENEQPTTPAQPVELTEEELGQVVGGGVVMPYGPSARPDGIIMDG